MSVPWIQTAFSAGEISPSLFGHVDLSKFSVAAATSRNLFVSYRGGLYSRAGTGFVGFSKQTGRNFPPRLITFQFSINQGLALEFGHLYMRVIANGGYVTESALQVTGITQANPAVVTYNSMGGESATPVNTFTVSSYAPGDQITLAGGTFSTPAIFGVTNTLLLALEVNNPGIGNYAPGNTVHLTGGTQTTPAILTVQTTRVVSATIAAAGTGGTDGTQTVTGTTGTGTKFQAKVTVAGGLVTAVLSISVAGAYTVNPTTPAAEPVTGAALVGAELDIVLGINTIAISNAGVFTANPVGNAFTQASSSGPGTGATFRFAILGPHAVSVVSAGSYSVFPGNPVAQASSTGTGLGVTFNVVNGSASAFNNGDWVFLTDIGGMTQLNGRTAVVAGATATTVQLQDVYGNPIDSTAFGAYTGGGSIARVFTLATPYAEEDLPFLKFTQSADVMSLCCWNQETGTDYPLNDLKRFSDTDWVLSPVTFSEVIAPPTGVNAAATSPTGTTSAQYSFVVTSVDAQGNESIASAPVTLASVDIASEQGAITIVWSGGTPNVNTYNVYQAPVAVDGSTVPVGSLYGYLGTAYGLSFTDSNIVPDQTQVPPTHQNPFSPGQITTVQITSGGASITGLSFVINTATGSGFIGVPVMSFDGTTLEAFIIQNSGQNYQFGDTITFFVSGGSVPSAILKIGPQTGTYPSVVNYYQERLVYAGSPNNPDTYWMSQPGAFKNFDSRIPTIPSDAITGTPWSVEVNGIQFMVSMPGGLVVLTGLSAWQLTGVGGSSLNPQPITPANQQAQPQAYNGCHSHVPPIKIDYDILYVQAKGSIIRDLSYNFFSNIYTGSDLTQISSHLFTGYQTREWAWCEEPYKIAWVVRDDGVLLSLTYLKPQEVAGWTRHDTNGLFQSVCSVTEPPVDALYTAVQRFPGGKTAYMIERMNNRIWSSIEQAWCVDAGLSLPQTEPNATLSVNSATGLGTLTGVTALVGGQNYSGLTIASVVDDNGVGPGHGAVPVLTIVGGVITAVTFAPGGSQYINPALVFTDPSGQGTGASALLVLDNSADFSTSAPIFNVGMVGDVMRAGGGIATITHVTDSQHVTANITSPLVSALIPNSGGLVAAQMSGTWTLTAPVTVISGLWHLIGATVTGLADGNVIQPTIVSSEGTITLGTPASQVTVGLGFQAQFQSVYLNAGQPTIQGQRKKIAAVTARVENSRGLKMGSNQVDGSTLSPSQIAPVWNNLDPALNTATGTDGGEPVYGSDVVPLFTGDIRIPVTGGFQKPGQVALQQDNPLPMQILAIIPEVLPGDLPETEAKEPNRRDRQAA